MGRGFLRKKSKKKGEENEALKPTEIQINAALPNDKEQKEGNTTHKKKREKIKKNAWGDERKGNANRPNTRPMTRPDTSETMNGDRAKVPASVIKARRKAEAEEKRRREEEKARQEEEEERRRKELEKKPIIYDACVRCMEDGTNRICCGTIYCNYCYTIETKCPTCNTASVVDETQFKGMFAREGEECRICLAQGFKRKCCGEFYCNACYYKTGYCPSCRQSVKNQPLATGSGLLTYDPEIPPVVIGYCLSLWVVLTFLALVGFIVANELAIPPTVFGYRCYGIFQECSTERRCLELDGLAEDGLTNLAYWTDCTNTSLNKMRGTTCIYDGQLYKKSQGAAGYDFCLEEFNEGVYVMEDTFDYWQNSTDFSSNIEASALWNSMTNAETSTYCGSNSGTKALYFSGPNVREITTQDVDMRYGGTINFHLKMGPQVYNEDDVTCKPSYSGEVTLLYSIDQGESWHSIYTYEPGLYAATEFREVNQALPANASSSVIRFKWKQQNFEAARDHWALDDVNIHHLLEDGWINTDWYSDVKEETDYALEMLQCCYKTEQCETPQYNQDSDICELDLPGIDGKDYPIRGPELYIVFAGVCALFKFLYNLTQKYIMHGREAFIPKFFEKKTASIFHADDAPGDAMNREFRCYTNQEWRRNFMLGIGIPFLGCWFWSAAMMENYYLVEDTYDDGSQPIFRIHISAILLLATYLDVREFYFVARHVVCVFDRWLPILEIDARLNNSFLRVGKEHIPLHKIRVLEKTSFEQHRRMAFYFMAGAFPWALFSLVLRFNYIPFYVSRWSSKLIGAILCCRAYYGPELWVKFEAWLFWLLTCSLYNRDVIGIAIDDERTRFLMIHLAVTGSVISAVILGFLNWGVIGFALFLLVVYLSALYGAMVGWSHGLPIVPKYYLTALTKDSRGVYLVYDKEILCPCKYGGKMWAQMNAKRERLLIVMEDDSTFSEMLRG